MIIDFTLSSLNFSAKTSPQSSRPANVADVSTTSGSTHRGLHEVQIIDGRFMHAECSCGWQSPGRRARAQVRTEALEHVRAAGADSVDLVDLADLVDLSTAIIDLGERSEPSNDAPTHQTKTA